MKRQIPIGYTSPGGDQVIVPVDHTVITGRTQQSGKTTTAEAMAHHVDAPVLAFVTKRDEHGFRDAVTVPPMYFGRVDWEWVVTVLRAGLDRPDLDEGWIIRLCQTGGFKKQKWPKPKTLADVLENCETALRSSDATALHKLRTYLTKVVPAVSRLTPTTKLPRLVNGINMMDLRDYPLAVQFIIMGNTLEWVYEHARDMIVLIPEAQKFFPLKSSTPLKSIGEKIINERAAAPVFLWLDTQMLRNLDTAMRGQIGVWLFGVQQEINEAKRTLEHCPEHLQRPTLSQLMQLKRGFFVACFRQTLIPKMYVQPFFMGDAHAQAIAMGEAAVESAEKIWKEKKKTLPQRRTYEKETAQPDAQQGNQGEPGRSGDTSQHNRGGIDPDPVDGKEETEEIPIREILEEIKEQSGNEGLDRFVGECEAEAMYQEKFEEVCQILEQLLLAPQTGPAYEAKRIWAQNEFARLRCEVVDPAAGDGAQPSEAAKAQPFQAQPRLRSINMMDLPPRSNGELSEALWLAIKARAAEDPGVLELLASRPELRLKVERPVIPAEGVLIPLAKLLHDGFFKEGRRSKEVEAEFTRRARSEARPTIYKGLQELCQLGFLTKEEVGKREYEYRAVPGMKVTVSE